MKEWSRAQNVHTREYLDGICFAPKLRERFRDYHQVVDLLFCPGASEGPVVWGKASPAKQQPFFVTMDRLEDGRKETVLVDPNAMDAKSLVSIDWYRVSPNAKLAAVSLSKAGSESGVSLTLRPARLSTTWPRVNGGTTGGAWRSSDSAGFAVPREGERPLADTNFYQQIYYHRLSTPAAQDCY